MYDKSGRASDADIKRLTESLNKIPDPYYPVGFSQIQGNICDPLGIAQDGTGLCDPVKLAKHEELMKFLLRKRPPKSVRIHTRRVKQGGNYAK
jgi:hypothetical protein